MFPRDAACLGGSGRGGTDRYSVPSGLLLGNLGRTPIHDDADVRKKIFTARYAQDLVNPPSSTNLALLINSLFTLRLARAPMKRSSTTKNSSQPQDPREELSQVAGLVEKRRIQNRISQRNYRNKIRDRLEALEALVDQKTKDEAADNSRPVSPGTARSSTTVDTSSKRAKVVAQVSAPTTPQEDPTNQWDPVNEFLDASTADLDDIYDLAYQSFSSDHFPDPTSPSLFTTGPESMPRNLPDPALTIGLSPSNTIDIPEPQNPKSGDDATSSLDPVAPPPGLFTGSPSSHQPPPHAHRQTYNAFSFAYPVPLAMPISPMSTMFYQGVEQSQNSASSTGVEGMTPNPAFQQQFVWVPVPVMTMPPQGAQQPMQGIQQPGVRAPGPSARDM